MLQIPTHVTASRLYSRLARDTDLLASVLSLRATTAEFSAAVSRVVPGFTDHSVVHMDALWRVTDKVLTDEEVEGLSPAEAFLLSASFYLHDAGMAYASTAEGLKEIEASPDYAVAQALFGTSDIDLADVRVRALAFSLRKRHAEAALVLATDAIPGTSQFLIESVSVRTGWGDTLGLIAASHNWPLERVEREFGAQGTVPLPGERSGDLGYIACLLRVIDFAHINRDRASTQARFFRGALDKDSLVHWLAQEHVDGPHRDGADLVYRAATPLSDVDAWWLYYEMLRGLDEEIRTVRRYLDKRATSARRLSLQGVRGVTSPEEASVLIPTAGFLPIEINLRTGSIDRLVQLLAGESLYGPDPMAPVRELLQNARDSVMLKSATASNDFERASLTLPIRVSVRNVNGAERLEVIDPGVGMSRKVMTDYLISIASDYWKSQFFVDYPKAQGAGFQPAGKFGIGFLSVFMLGDQVDVESNRSGGERLHLRLRGVGRRGEIRVLAPASGSGTKVAIELRAGTVEALRPLSDLVRAYAPMLPHPLEVEADDTVHLIKPGWLGELSTVDFHRWVLDAVSLVARHRTGRSREDGELALWFRRRFRVGLGEEDGEGYRWSCGWPELNEPRARIVASFEGVSLLCLKGLAVQPIPTPGFVGVIDLDEAVLDVSRRRALVADVSDLLKHAQDVTHAGVVTNINALAEGLLVNKQRLLGQLVSLYGRSALLDSTLPWISELRLPGEVHLRSCSSLLRSLTDAKSLFVAYGTGPWTAMKQWVTGKGSESELAVVLEGGSYEGLGYQAPHDEKIGSLSEIWPGSERSSLFGLLIGLVAEAWQVSVEELMAQGGWHHSGSSLWGRVTRS